MNAAVKHERAEAATERAPMRHTRSRRKRAVPPTTIKARRISKLRLELERALYADDELDDVRPKTRADCAEGMRPCPFISCKHHLYLDVSPRTGSIKLNFPDVDPANMKQLADTCALDVAERGGETLEGVAERMNMTRERARQIELEGLVKVRAASGAPGYEAIAEEGRMLLGTKRRLPVLQGDDEQRDESKANNDDDDADGEAHFDVEHFASVALDAE